VHNEFEGNFSDDNVRLELILNQSINDRTHPMAIFGWGNMESLAGKDKETLCDDVKKYHAEHYSSDRLNLVIQTKFPEGSNIDTLKTWINNSFGTIPNKNYGI
jgi:secreted Zn-dependent insulinase-like peptidase